MAALDEAVHLLATSQGIVAELPPSEELHVAAERNDHPALLRALAREGTDLDALDSQLVYTPAIHAAANDAVGALVTLREHGADLEKQGRHGITPAFAAAAGGSTGALSVLIDSGADLDVECREQTALEYLGGGQDEGGPTLRTRLHGPRLQTAQMLLLAGASVEAGIITHRPSRDILRRWAQSELAVEDGLTTFILSLKHGISSQGMPCLLSMLAVEGVPQQIISYLPRRTAHELGNLSHAVWVWDDEMDDEAFRAETRAFPRHHGCVDEF